MKIYIHIRKLYYLQLIKYSQINIIQIEDHHAKQSKPAQKDKYHMFSLTCGI